MSREARASVANLRKAWVDRWPKAVKRNLQSAVIEGADQTADMMRALVPVDQGKLKASISTSVSVDGLKAYIHAGDTMSPDDVVKLTRRRSGKRLQAFYGVLVEYGTRFRKATPFFWPAWRAMKRPLKRKFSRVFAKAFKSGSIPRNPL